MEPEEIRARVQAKMAEGVLHPGRTMRFTVVSGDDIKCLVCGEPIRDPALDFEFEGGVHLDARCFKIWLEELGYR
jgi:hypothetical protein